MNCKMAELRHCLEAAGFGNVKTVLASGNAVFDARSASSAAIQKKAESAMKQHLGRSFHTVVRPQEALQALINNDPFAKFKVPGKAKRVVTFTREAPKAKLKLPHSDEGVHVFAIRGCEIFTAYEPHPRGPIFMQFIEKTFGPEVTTRTWDTVKKCAAA
jgi:uncharacterized protein (DUF1697 family)